MCAWNPQTAYEDIMAAGEHKADATMNYRTLEHTKPVAKMEAIASLVGTENPLTGKPHSASSAETMVESVPRYAEPLRALRVAELDRILADAKYEAIRAAHREVAS